MSFKHTYCAYCGNQHDENELLYSKFCLDCDKHFITKYDATYVGKDKYTQEWRDWINNNVISETRKLKIDKILE